MNILSKITLNGHIHPMYAVVSAEYTFSCENITPEFILPLPVSACITNLKILDRNKCITSGTVKPVTDDFSDNGITLLSSEDGLYHLLWDSPVKSTQYTFIIDMIIKLSPIYDIAELILPTGLPFSPSASAIFNSPSFEAEFYADSDISIYSPTHSLNYQNDHISYIGECGKDFALYIDLSSKTVENIIEESLGTGVGIFRVPFPSPSAIYTSPKKLVFILDLSVQRYNPALKELLFKAIQGLGNNIRIQVLAGNSCLFPDFCQPNPDMVYEKLSLLEATQNNLENLLSEAKAFSDAEIILISSGIGLNSCQLGEIANLHLITFGDYCPRIKGVDRHFYNFENIDIWINKVITDIIAKEDIVITVEDCSARDILILTDNLLDGYIDVAISYTGRQPQTFSVWKRGEIADTISIPPTIPMKIQPVAQKLYAHYKVNSLLSLIPKAGVVSVRAIKEEIQNIGIKYQLLTTETVMTIETQKGEVPVRQLISYGRESGFEPFLNKPSLFKEFDQPPYLVPYEKERLISLCKDILVRSIRKDGAITDSLEKNQRVCDTVLSISALTLMEDRAYIPVINQGLSYIGNQQTEGLAFSLLTHLQTLKDFILQNSGDLLALMPDFYTLINTLRIKPDVNSAATLVVMLYLK